MAYEDYFHKTPRKHPCFISVLEGFNHNRYWYSQDSGITCNSATLVVLRYTFTGKFSGFRYVRGNHFKFKHVAIHQRFFISL